MTVTVYTTWSTVNAFYPLMKTPCEVWTVITDLAGGWVRGAGLSTKQSAGCKKKAMGKAYHPETEQQHHRHTMQNQLLKDKMTW